ncbi:MAG TPA: hypothetical protein PLS60_14690, partial [Arenimonas sp.]|nr:hypothetical protein [Arenimonas sp.]
SLAMAQLSLGGGIQPAGRVYSRFWLGLFLKWLIVGLVLFLSFRMKALAPLAIAAGVILALVVFPLVAMSGNTTRARIPPAAIASGASGRGNSRPGSVSTRGNVWR